MAKERKKRPQPETEPTQTEELAPSSMPNDDFVRGSAKGEVQATGSLGMFLWLYSPAKVLLLTDPTRSLAEAAHLRGMPNRKIEAVEAMLQISTRTIFLTPVEKDEVDDAYKVTYKSEGKNAEINLRTLLQPRGLEVTRGWREKYAVKLDKESKFGPALVFQLTTNPPREKVGKSRQEKSQETPAVDAKPKRSRAKKTTQEGQTPDTTAPDSKPGTPTESPAPKSDAPKKVDGGPPPTETI